MIRSWTEPFSVIPDFSDRRVEGRLKLPKQPLPWLPSDRVQEKSKIPVHRFTDSDPSSLTPAQASPLQFPPLEMIMINPIFTPVPHRWGSYTSLIQDMSFRFLIVLRWRTSLFISYLFPFLTIESLRVLTFYRVCLMLRRVIASVSLSIKFSGDNNSFCTTSHILSNLSVEHILQSHLFALLHWPLPSPSTGSDPWFRGIHLLRFFQHGRK